MPEAGRRVEAFMRAAMARSDRVRTVSALAEVAHVQRQTLYDIWKGRSPKPGTVEALTEALGETPGSFWAAWEGRDPTASANVAAAIDRQTGVLERILLALEGMDRPTRLRPAGVGDAARVVSARSELEADLDALEESTPSRPIARPPGRAR